MKPLAPSSSLATPLTPPLPTTRRQALCWSGLHGCSDSLAIASAIGASPGLFVVVTADAQSALRIEQEVKTFLGGDAALLPFPDWEILPYDVFSPLPEITSQRLRTFYELSRIQHGLLITPVSTLMHRVAPRTHTLANTFSIRTGSAVNIDQTRQTLESVGYQCVPQVYQHGEFAIRGSILNLYPMGSETPYRIELFDD